MYRHINAVCDALLWDGLALRLFRKHFRGGLL